jgi:hypothetical protein
LEFFILSIDVNKWNLVPSIIVCSDCGAAWRIGKEEPPCEHLKEFVEEIRSDPKFKEW